MQEKGELNCNGYRSARTKETSEVSPIHGISVFGTVACGPGQEEEQRFVETIRIPEPPVEKGDCFCYDLVGFIPPDERMKQETA